MNPPLLSRPALRAVTALGFILATAPTPPARAAGGDRADTAARQTAASLPGSASADPDGIAPGNFLWDGGGGSDNFSTPANWNPNVAPPNDGTGFLRFAGSTRLSPVADAAYSVYGISFETGAAAFTLSGAALTLVGGGFTQNSTNNQTINNSVTLQTGFQGISFGSGAGSLSFGNDFIIGFGSGNTATVNVAAGTLNAPSGGNATSVGTSLGTGTLNISGTAALSVNTFYVGNIGTGTVNQTGGSVTTNAKNLYVAFKTTNDIGNYTLSGASSTLTTSNTIIGYRGTGAFTQSGGTHTAGALTFGSSFTSSASNATYHLNGGTLVINSVGSTSPSNLATSVFNFNGGTLRPRSDSTAFFSGILTANVRNGGAQIDTDDFNVTVAQALVHSGISGDAATDGGLTKTGTGTLTLSATNTYNGGTFANGGTLIVGTAGALGTAGSVFVASGATLDFTSLSGSAYTLASGRIIQNLGTVSGNLTVASGATLLGAGTLNGALTVNSGGSVTLTSGTLTVNGTVTNNGTMRFARGASLAVAGSGSTFVNNGTLDIITGSFTVPAGGFTNNGVVLDSRVVKVKSVSRAPGSVSVSIDSYTGHLYRLQRNDSLNSATFADITGVPAQGSPTGSVLTFTDNNPAADKGFYRVIVDEM